MGISYLSSTASPQFPHPFTLTNIQFSWKQRLNLPIKELKRVFFFLLKCSDNEEKLSLWEFICMKNTHYFFFFIFQEKKEDMKPIFQMNSWTIIIDQKWLFPKHLSTCIIPIKHIVLIFSMRIYISYSVSAYQILLVLFNFFT